MTKTRRAVIIASPDRAVALSRLFEHPDLAEWQASVAESPQHARYLTKLLACDVLLLDDSAPGFPGDCSLEWLSGRGRWPVIFLSSSQAGLIELALQEGASAWLPCDLVLAEPALLAAGLRHALRSHATQSRLRAMTRTARMYRTQVGRLADLMWTAMPVEGRPGWLSQRYMLERLHQEVLRSERHGTPLTLVLGEWSVNLAQALGDPLARSTPGLEAEQRVREWTVGRVMDSKRRSDVAGQYGAHGFMLLLPHTSDRGARDYCRRLRGDLTGTPPGLPGLWRLQAALGFAGFSEEARTAKSLLCQAEERLEHDRHGESGN